METGGAGLETLFCHSSNRFWDKDIFPEPLLLQEFEGSQRWTRVTGKRTLVYNNHGREAALIMLRTRLTTGI